MSIWLVCRSAVSGVIDDAEASSRVKAVEIIEFPMDLSISGRSVRQSCRTVPSIQGHRIVAVPPLLKGHSITIQFHVAPGFDHIWVCFGTSDIVKSNPGLVANLSKLGGNITHVKPASSQSGRQTCSARKVATYSKDVSQVKHFWMVWREGLLFVGCGNVGESLLMAADVASDDNSVGLDVKAECNRRFVTDDVAAIFIGCGNLEIANPTGSPVEWDFVARALWRNSPCRYARALTTCDSSLPEASPKDKIVRDKSLGRKLVTLTIPRLPGTVSLSELAWWLRFAYKPKHGLLARALLSGLDDERVGHNIDVDSVRYLTEGCGERKVQLNVRVTQEVLKSLLSNSHTIKDPDVQIWILQD